MISNKVGVENMGEKNLINTLIIQELDSTSLIPILENKWEKKKNRKWCQPCRDGKIVKKIHS